MKNAIRAVVFDLGQTLWHYDALRPPRQVYEMQARRLERLLARWEMRIDSSLGALSAEIWERYMLADRAEWAAGSLAEPARRHSLHHRQPRDRHHRRPG